MRTSPCEPWASPDWALFGATFGRILAMGLPFGASQGKLSLGIDAVARDGPRGHPLAEPGTGCPAGSPKGFSMMEERHAGPGWGDGLSPSLVRAYERGEIAPVKDLNKGFESPRTREHLQISYLQAGLVAR